MNQFQICLTVLIAGTILFVSCSETAPSADDVLERERERISALAAGDYDRLDGILSPTLTYTHSNAVLDSKEAFLGTLRSGEVIYRNLEHSDLQVRLVTPDVAVMNGRSDVSVTVGGEDREVPLRFTIVYVLEDGEWMFEAWQSVGIPEQR